MLVPTDPVIEWSCLEDVEGGPLKGPILRETSLRHPVAVSCVSPPVSNQDLTGERGSEAEEPIQASAATPCVMAGQYMCSAVSRCEGRTGRCLKGSGTEIVS